MPEIFQTQRGSDPLFDGKTSEELEALLDNLTPEGDIPPEQIPVEPVPEPAPEPEPTPEPTPTPEPESEPEPEIDLAASQVEGDRLAREKLEAALLLQQAHSSRLAGEIGYLKKKLEAVPQSSEPYQPETQAEIDRLTALENKFAQSEARRVEIETSQAIESEFNALDGDWSNELATEIAAVVPKYKDQIEFAKESANPEMARQITRAVGLLVKAEAMQMRWDTKHKALVEKRASTAKSVVAAKKATAPSGSGSVPEPAPKPKSAGDMTVQEADAWLRANVP